MRMESLVLLDIPSVDSLPERFLEIGKDLEETFKQLTFQELMLMKDIKFFVNNYLQKEEKGYKKIKMMKMKEEMKKK